MAGGAKRRLHPSQKEGVRPGRHRLRPAREPAAEAGLAGGGRYAPIRSSVRIGDQRRPVPKNPLQALEAVAEGAREVLLPERGEAVVPKGVEADLEALSAERSHIRGGHPRIPRRPAGKGLAEADDRDPTGGRVTPARPSEAGGGEGR